MNTNKYLLISILFIAFSSITLLADNQQFGYVNVADALLLHPTMRHFDPANKLFKIDVLKLTSPEKRIEENQVKFKEKLSKLNKELEELEKEKLESSDKHQKDLQALTTSTGDINSLSESQKKKFNEKKETINKEFFENAATTRKKIVALKNRIKECEKEGLYTGFASQGETSRIFSLMLDDVYEAMNAIATHYKVSFVFNSSAEINYIEGRWLSTNPLPEFFDNYEEIVQERDGKKITGAAFTSWLTERNSTFLNCNDRRLSAFVMKGGVNMTPAVIDYIYQKHKISKEHRDFVIEYFSKYVNNDNQEE